MIFYGITLIVGGLIYAITRRRPRRGTIVLSIGMGLGFIILGLIRPRRTR